jgi:uncharacterized protein (TIRG00374 family)
MGKLFSSRRFRIWLGIFVGVACLAAIFLFIKPTEIIEKTKDSRRDLWLVAAGMLIIFLLLRAIRWRYLLNSGLSQSNKVAYSDVFHIQNIGYLLNNVLPLRLGDVARAILIGNIPPITVAEGLSTVVVERVFDLLFVVILFPFVTAAVNELPPLVEATSRAAGVMAITGAIVLIIAANRRSQAKIVAGFILERTPRLDSDRWIQRLDGLLLGLNVLTRWKDGTILVILSIVVWIPIIVGYLIGMMAFHLQPSLVEAAFVVCAAAFGVSAPSTPGQFGPFEFAVTLAMTVGLGISGATAASFAIAYHAVNIVVTSILGFIGLIRTSVKFDDVVKSTQAYEQIK